MQRGQRRLVKLAKRVRSTTFRLPWSDEDDLAVMFKPRASSKRYGAAKAKRDALLGKRKRRGSCRHETFWLDIETRAGRWSEGQFTYNPEWTTARGPGEIVWAGGDAVRKSEAPMVLS